MSIRWLDEPAQRAFAAAVEAVERASAAEVMVSIRRSARRWPHVPITVGLLAAWAALAFMLYADHPFALPSFLIDPLVVGALAGAAATVLPPLVRWLTPYAIRRRAARREAQATFVDLGVHRTRGRTGLLIYCALTERIAIVVTDDGVSAAVKQQALAERERAIEAAIRRGGAAAAHEVEQLAPLLAAGLPRAHDDVNELPDAIDHDLVRRPRS